VLGAFAFFGALGVDSTFATFATGAFGVAFGFATLATFAFVTVALTVLGYSSVQVGSTYWCIIMVIPLLV